MERSEIEALKREIRELARKSYEKIIEDAKRKAREIIEEARKEAEEISKTIKEKVIKEVRNELNRKLMSIRMKYRYELMKLKYEAIEEVFKKAEGQLKEFVSKDREEYYRVLHRLLKQAIENLEEYREYIIYARDEDINIVEEIIRELSRKYPNHVFKVVKSPVEFIGGIIVYAPEGAVFFNNTFDARLSRIKEYRINEVINVLFGGASIEGRCH